ncbi:hypothetical protein SCA6_017786 [Theobroma cacao]
MFKTVWKCQYLINFSEWHGALQLSPDGSTLVYYTYIYNLICETESCHRRSFTRVYGKDFLSVLLISCCPLLYVQVFFFGANYWSWDLFDSCGKGQGPGGLDSQNHGRHWLVSNYFPVPLRKIGETIGPLVP